MPIFHYQALDPSGTLHKGSQDATTETEVRQFLREKQWFPTEIRTSRFTFSHRKSGSASKTSFKLPKLFSRSNHRHSLTLFT
ncbi:MAG TPA: general secretion pathway protein GspF, partial [Deltaproteobacteria bacterium]|nr:general secretion pathway protein GspF [Deltaproteobacteria bacterium]